MEENNNKVPADSKSISGAETSATPGVPAAIGIYDRPVRANVSPMLVIVLVLLLLVGAALLAFVLM